MESNRHNNLAGRQTNKNHLRILVFVYLTIHTLLFFFDVSHSQAFFQGDRTRNRFNSINSLLTSLENNSFSVDTLINLGVPGDYVFHTAVYAIYQSYAVILVQIAVGLIAIIYLYLLTQQLFHSTIISAVTTVTYMLLPATLVHPHTLVTEAFYNPLLIISFYYSVKYLLKGNNPSLLIAGFTASLAAFIRLIFVLYPLVFFITILFSKNRNKLRGAFSYLLLAFSLPVLWMSINFFYTGDFTMGGSRLPRNLYLRIERMAALEEIDLNPADYPIKEMDREVFVDYLLKHPRSFLRTLLSDVYNLSLNTGINTFAGRYLDFYEMPESTKYWKEIRDQQGLGGALVELLRWSPRLIITNIIMALFWVLFLLLAGYGFTLFLRDTKFSLLLKFTVFFFPAYIIATQFAASTPRWSHRSPAEFVFAMMFALAVVHLWTHRAQRKTLTINEA